MTYAIAGACLLIIIACGIVLGLGLCRIAKEEEKKEGSHSDHDQGGPGT